MQACYKPRDDRGESNRPGTMTATPEETPGSSAVRAAAPVRARVGLLQAAIAFSFGSLPGMIVSFARSAVVGRELSATSRGEWLALQLVLAYTAQLHFGVHFGLYRSAAMRLGANDIEGLRREKATAFAVTLGASALALLAGLVASFAIAPSEPIAAAWIGALSAASIFRSYYISALKAESQFTTLGKATLVASIVGLPSLFVISRWGIRGVLFGLFAQMIVELMYLARFESIVSPRIHGRVLRAQLAIGLGVLAVTAAQTAVASSERVAMLRVIGKAATGDYYVGAMVATFVPLLGAIPFAVVAPRLFEEVGRGGTSKDLLRWTVGAARMAADGLAFFVGVGALALPLAVALVWPTQIGGIRAAQIAVFGTYAAVLTNAVSASFFALSRLVAQFVIVVVCAGISFAVAIAALHLRPTVEVGAAAGAFGLYLSYVASVFGTCWISARSTRDGWPHLAATLWQPTAVAATVLLCSNLVQSRFPLTTPAGFAAVEAIYLVLMSPLAIRSLRRLRDLRAGQVR